MSHKIHFTPRPLIIFAVLGVLAALLALSAPTRTYATFDPDTETPTPTETPIPTSTPSTTVEIISIEPASVGNASSSTITLIGSGFVSGAVVVLQNTSTLSTTFVTSTMLTAVVPAGVSGGKYDVQVINPDSSSGFFTDGLTVVNQNKATKTPEPTSTPKATVYARPVISMASYTSSIGTAYPGQNVDFGIVLQNTGEIAARDITVSVSSDDLIPRDSGGLTSLDTLSSGDSTSFTLPMRVSGDLSGYDAIATLTIRYFDKYGNSYSDTATIGVKAQQVAATPTPSPTPAILTQLALTNYQTTPTDLTPGMEFTLSMDISNVSSQTARQVVAMLNISDDNAEVVNLKNSGGTRFVEEIQPGKSEHLEFNMIVSGSASGQLVPVTLDMTYLDDTNTQQTLSEKLSLQINTTPFLMIHYLEEPGAIQVGETTDIEVEVINIGTSSLNVSTIELLSDDLTITDGSLYIGPLDSSTSGSIAAQATGLTAGTATLSVNVHYLDDNQQEQIAVQELTLEVEAIPTPTPSEDQGQSTQSGASQTALDRLVQVALAFFGLSVQTNGPQGGAGLPTGQNGAFPSAGVTPTP